MQLLLTNMFKYNNNKAVKNEIKNHAGNAINQ